MNQGIAVNFRGGGDQKAGAFVLGQAQGLVRAQRTDLQRLDRQFEIINRAGRRGEVPDIVHGFIEKDEFGDILLDEFEVPVAAQMGDVVHAAGDEVINANHPVSPGEQQVGEMRTKKTGRAGNDGSRLGGFGFSHGYYFC